MSDVEYIGPRPLDDIKAAARYLDRHFNGNRTPDEGPAMGYVLLVAPFGASGQHIGELHYASNGVDHSDALALMKEVVARFEGQALTRGTA